MSKPKKVLIAAGGTGGHLFPAQALAKDLLEKDIQVLFAGAGLSSNRNFLKDRFSFEEVLSSTPYRKKDLLRSVFLIARGIKQAFRVLKNYQPDLVVGFGSFHSFPLLMAALLKRVPIILFESNSFPGKVNRFFSKWAVVSAVQFSLSAKNLSGKKVEVSMPIWEKEGIKSFSTQEAREYYSLDPSLATILVFGGSQGAASINKVFSETALLLKKKMPFQILHFTGDQKTAIQCKDLYEENGIPSCVKPFEDKMTIAWKAASFAVCRSGAATLAELVSFEVPGILIPYPFAADDHQRINAEFFVNMGCASLILDTQLNTDRLFKAIEEIASLSENRLEKMRGAITSFKKTENKQSLSSLVAAHLKN